MLQFDNTGQNCWISTPIFLSFLLRIPHCRDSLHWRLRQRTGDFVLFILVVWQVAALWGELKLSSKNKNKPCWHHLSVQSVWKPLNSNNRNGKHENLSVSFVLFARTLLHVAVRGLWIPITWILAMQYDYDCDVNFLSTFNRLVAKDVWIECHLVAACHFMVTQGQGTTWRSPFLSRSNKWPLSSSWNPSHNLRTIRTSAQWCRVATSYFTYNWETRAGRERLTPSRTGPKDLPSAQVICGALTSLSVNGRWRWRCDYFDCDRM